MVFKSLTFEICTHEANIKWAKFLYKIICPFGAEFNSPCLVNIDQHLSDLELWTEALTAMNISSSIHKNKISSNGKSVYKISIHSNGIQPTKQCIVCQVKMANF